MSSQLTVYKASAGSGKTFTLARDPWGEPYLLSDRRITWHVGQSPSPGRRTHQFFENDISPPTDACDPSGTDLSRFPNHPSRTIS